MATVRHGARLLGGIRLRSGGASVGSFKRLTPVEHVLLRPGMYVGSTAAQRETLWVHDDATGRMEWREVRYVPALFKIFDELLVNALDNLRRDAAGTSRIDLGIHPATGKIVVRNDGRGIPVQRDAEGVWLPELVMGNLFSGSNFDDEAKLTVGGRHGFGAKLANIFSAHFSIETADTDAGLSYSQEWRQNMSIRSEPQIVKLTSRAKDFTQISLVPDFARFGNLADDVDDVDDARADALQADSMAIFRRRALEAAACAAPAKVRLNGEVLRVDGLKGLMELYLPDKAAAEAAELAELAENGDGVSVGGGVGGGTGRRSPPRLAVARLDDRWEVGVCASPLGGFAQVSFVNGVCTSRGGTHVTHACNALFKGLLPRLAKVVRLPPEEMTAARVKPHLMIFVNCLVDNPEFDSQAKEKLTTPADRFGGECVVSEKLAAAAARVRELVAAVAAAGDRRTREALAKRARESRRGGSKTNLAIAKLDDAELAGTTSASECTLIVTEGDSAKALAVAGLEVLGRERWGVFPLRGKVLNVREATSKKLVANEEITNLMGALGLEPGRSYDSDPGKRQRLRYGRLMLMTDQDADGAHIKGLVISMLHAFWPELLRSSFVQEFVTPLLKVRHAKGSAAAAFFSAMDYEAWLQSMPAAERHAWRTKYYKGLGTSSASEAREYFSDLGRHRVQLTWASESDGELIDMAFAKKRVADRKQWMLDALERQTPPPFTDGDPPVESPPSPPRRRTSSAAAAAAAAVAAAAALSSPPSERSFTEFVQRDLVEFAHANLMRSVPSLVDGLKPGQRKVLHACMQKRLVGSAEMKVAQLAGYVAEATQYHHGEQALVDTIVRMAQDFVGANNLPLLEPLGQFGTRALGGEDAASARYIFTRLSPLVPKLFPAVDAQVLEYREEDGHRVEPVHFVPLLPMLLINGAAGIGSGWSTQVWGYHPLEVLDSVLAALNGERMPQLLPWAAGFEGQIEMGRRLGPTGEPTYFTSRGVATPTAEGMEVSELPLGRWTEAFKSWLLEQQRGQQPLWQSFSERHSERRVRFLLRLNAEQRAALSDLEVPLEAALKLEARHSLTNMHAFDASGKLVHLHSPQRVVDLYLPVRLRTYRLRQQHLLAALRREQRALDVQARFIRLVVSGELQIIRRSHPAVVEQLQRLGFEPYLDDSVAEVDSPDPSEDTSASTAAPPKGSQGNREHGNPYDHLLRMPLMALTEERLARLEKRCIEAEAEAHALAQTEPEEMYRHELESLRSELEAYLEQRGFRR